jgi:hypothetical protein
MECTRPGAAKRPGWDYGEDTEEAEESDDSDDKFQLQVETESDNADGCLNFLTVEGTLSRHFTFTFTMIIFQGNRK